MEASGTKPALSGKQAGQQGSGPKRIIKMVIILAVVIAAVVALYVRLSGKEDAHRLDVSGRLDGYETNLSPKIGGRIDSIAVREGARVTIGQVVARLSDADYQAQLRGAVARIKKAQEQVRQKSDQLQVVEAQILGARKRLAQSKEETTAEISQAAASLAEAKDKEQQSKSDLVQASAQLRLSSIRLQRYTNLVKKGAVTKDEYDQAATTHDNDTAVVAARESAEQAAAKNVQAARATLAQQQAQRFTPPIRVTDLDVAQAQREQAQHDLEGARHDVANAIADRDQTQANLDYLKIFSPINGVITARPVEPGAVLTPGQTVLTVLDYAQVYLRAFVPEGRIGSVRVGQKAVVYLDAMPKRPFNGHVIEIDPEGSFTPENIYFKDDRVKQVFGIKIGLDDPAGFAKPGMPADATIEI